MEVQTYGTARPMVVPDLWDCQACGTARPVGGKPCESARPMEVPGL